MTKTIGDAVQMSASVADALAENVPVVALESTVYSNLGLPSPHNREAYERCVAAISAAGAVAAVTAVLDGRMWLGIEDSQIDIVLDATTKTAERDLPVALGQRWPVGVTTVSASLAIAAIAGVEVFATGGIGGVHRGVETTGDVSADLGAIARHPVATVSSGAKSFLDLPRTLETLETLGVPVIGWRTDTFPAFTSRTSGLAIAHRIDELAELASVVRSQLRFDRGLLIVNPVPEADGLEQKIHDDALAMALAEADAAGVDGPEVTPFVLQRVAESSGGASVPANLALVESNSRLAAELAVSLSF